MLGKVYFDSGQVSPLTDGKVLTAEIILRVYGCGKRLGSGMSDMMYFGSVVSGSAEGTNPFLT